MRVICVRRCPDTIAATSCDRSHRNVSIALFAIFRACLRWMACVVRYMTVVGWCVCGFTKSARDRMWESVLHTTCVCVWKSALCTKVARICEYNNTEYINAIDYIRHCRNRRRRCCCCRCWFDGLNVSFEANDVESPEATAIDHRKQQEVHEQQIGFQKATGVWTKCSR